MCRQGKKGKAAVPEFSQCQMHEGEQEEIRLEREGGMGRKLTDS